VLKHLCWLPPAAVLQVLPLPDELLLQHASLYDEFKNETHWPKHVLVHYHFRNEGDIDFQQGLYVLTALGATRADHPLPARQYLNAASALNGHCTTACSSFGEAVLIVPKGLKTSCCINTCTLASG
jgi:hypothetical protein